MTDDLERLLQTPGNPHSTARKATQHPQGVEPGIKFDGSRGEVTRVVPAGEDPRWDEWLKDAGFGDQLELLDVQQVRAWQTTRDGEPVWLHYLRANVVIRRRGEDALDVDELCKRIAKHKPKRPPKPRKGHQVALVVALADWQTGKRDGGGTKALVAEALALQAKVERRIKQLAAMGLQVVRIYLLGMGDLVEGCNGFYAMQTFSVELHRRDQVKLVRRLLVQLLQHLAGLVHEVVVGCVGGNHGEQRAGGKAFTWWGDNDDVAVVEQVAEVFASNPKAYKHVSFVIPRDELTLTLDALGTPIAFAHGHQWRGHRADDALKWWKDCEFHDHGIAGARVLVSGHRHHLRLLNSGNRTWLQCPALESESTWWKERGGAVCPAGTLTFCVGLGEWALGWGALEVL